MADLYRTALAAQLAGHVHQAAQITGQQGIGPGGQNIFGFVGNDGVRDVGIFDTECTAKTATDLGSRQFRQVQAGNLVQQFAGLGFDPEFTQARAAVVIGNGPVIARVNRVKPDNIGQKGGQFPRLAGATERQRELARASQISSPANSSG